MYFKQDLFDIIYGGIVYFINKAFMSN